MRSPAALVDQRLAPVGIGQLGIGARTSQENLFGLLAQRLGRLDSEAVQAILAEAGHKVRSARREAVAGLSEREIEVLRLIARGYSMRQMAEKLIISQKTVDHHIQHIYTKIGVSTRAAAALFAAEHNLLTDLAE